MCLLSAISGAIAGLNTQIQMSRPTSCVFRQAGLRLAVGVVTIPIMGILRMVEVEGMEAANLEV